MPQPNGEDEWKKVCVQPSFTYFMDDLCMLECKEMNEVHGRMMFECGREGSCMVWK